jgi:hypothetical protein
MKYFADEDVLTQFYNALADKDEGRLKRVHIPRSDVFYVREAIHQNTGVRYTLDRVERAMLLEGFLRPRDVLDPERVRKFEDGQEY